MTDDHTARTDHHGPLWLLWAMGRTAWAIIGGMLLLTVGILVVVTKVLLDKVRRMPDTTPIDSDSDRG